MTLNVRQFRYHSDNLGYLVFGRRQALAVDGGAVDAMLQFTRRNGLELRLAANTHLHADHTAGLEGLLDRSGARYLENRWLHGAGHFELEGHRIAVLSTPGHSRDSLCLHFDDTLISGDTLFNGTIGNCFSGDLEAFYASLCQLTALDGRTVVYAGHDYVAESMAVARQIEPDNPHIDAYLAAYDPGHVRSTLADELRVNPYLRYNTPALRAVLKSRGLPVETAYQRWQSVMTLG